jgi:low temperature requirement protein LtrA
LGCYSIWSSTGHTWFFNKIQNKPSWIRFDMFALCFCSVLHI